MIWRRWVLAGTRLARSGSGSAARLGGAASRMGTSTSSPEAAPLSQIQCFLEKEYYYITLKPPMRKEETISDNCVVIYSKTSCSYCHMAKKLFQDMNVSYKAVELDLLESGSQFQDALDKMTGERTVPRIFVNGAFIGGATDTHRLHQEGKLLPLVQQCYLKKSNRHVGDSV